MTDEQPRVVNESNDRIGIGLMIAVVLLTVLGVFIVQNGDRVRIEFLVFGASLPVWVVMGISILFGVFIAVLWQWIRRRRANR